MTAIAARDITNAHIGRAVQAGGALFVLDGFTVLTIEYNLFSGDSGRVNLRDQRGHYHSVDPDDLIEVES